MAPIITFEPKHIPAWKKLGLKLKNAKEEPEEDFLVQLPSTIVEEKSVYNRKRKAPDEGVLRSRNTDSNRAVKKPKKSKARETSNTDPANDISVTYIPSRSGQKAPQMVEGTSGSKRKSVSFTPETKAEDGDSVKQIYKTWLASQLATDPSFDTSTLSPALRSTTAPKITPKTSTTSSQLTSEEKPEVPAEQTPKESFQPKKAKKNKKKKDKSTIQKPHPDPSDPSQPTPPHLTYLTTYHTSRITWKFSKPHQNHILKNLFALRQIPPSYDAALLSYLTGLKGTSARQRIRAQAFEIRDSDNDYLSSKIPPQQNPEADNDAMDTEPDSARLSRRRKEYEAQIQRIKAMLRKKEDEREDREWEFCGEKEEWEGRLKKRRRAELVLWGVGETQEVEPATTQPAQVNGVNGVRQNTWLLGRDAAKLNAASAVPTKIVFRDDGAAAAAAAAAAVVVGGMSVNGSNDINRNETGANGHLSKSEPVGKKPRKRRAKKRTGVPDDEDDTSSSSSSGSSSDEHDVAKGGRKTIAVAAEEEQKKKKKKKKKKDGAGAESDGDSSSGSESGSDSGSGDETSPSGESE
ncbi:MAG: hypothetical protein Q9164_002114 [Protoblastenia rupestris]